MKPCMDIEVDGGINEKTISLAYEMGANLFVSGSFIMKAENVSARVEQLKNLVEG
jgi:ribulose-phosphate 3-epimerase